MISNFHLIQDVRPHFWILLWMREGHELLPVELPVAVRVGRVEEVPGAEGTDVELGYRGPVLKLSFGISSKSLRTFYWYFLIT